MSGAHVDVQVRRRARRPARLAAAVLAVSGLAMAAPGSAAGADTTGTVTAGIAAGSDGATVGQAVFTRTTTGSGETLQIDLSVAGGIKESHVCLSATPFTDRRPPGSCPYQQGETGTTARYTIDLGTTYAGRPVYAQVDVVTGADTAYAGWHAGQPFYGNVEVAATGEATAVPVGTIGAVGLALLLGAVLARRTLGRRTLGRRTLGRRTLGRRTLGRRRVDRPAPAR
ncbi:MAG: hypothetical protein LC792_17985 [Actinobacteria bacterium]|nr:hypothetical protein [Actinomycetota bacterium]